jgi:hypothetical protein
MTQLGATCEEHVRGGAGVACAETLETSPCIRAVCHLSNVVLSQVVKDGIERPDLVSSSTNWRVKVRSISQHQPNSIGG